MQEAERNICRTYLSFRDELAHAFLKARMALAFPHLVSLADAVHIQLNDARDGYFVRFRVTHDRDHRDAGATYNELRVPVERVRSDAPRAVGRPQELAVATSESSEVIPNGPQNFNATPPRAQDIEFTS